MEAIVYKILKKKLKLFIKNFHKEQFSLEVLKSTATLCDVELNEKVIQELLLIPPNLEVMSAKCNNLTMMIPWSRLKQKPIEVVLDRIDFHLAEPETLSPPPTEYKARRKRKHHKKKSKDGKQEKSELLRGMSFIIKEFHVVVKTRGSKNKFDPRWTPQLNIDIYDVTVQSTNVNWEVVPLNEAPTIDKATNTETTYKLLNARSITIALIKEGVEPIPLLSDQPVKIQFTLTYNLATNRNIAAMIEVFFQDINLSWNQRDWQMLFDFFRSFKACMSREAPPPAPLDVPQQLAVSESGTMGPRSGSGSNLQSSASSAANPNIHKVMSTPVMAPPSPSLPAPASPVVEGGNNSSSSAPAKLYKEVTIKLYLNIWLLELLEGLRGGDRGYSLFGNGLALTLCPRRLRTMTVPEGDQYATVLSAVAGTAGQLQYLETSLNVEINSFTVREKTSAKRDPRYIDLLGKRHDELVPQSPSTPSATAANAAGTADASVFSVQLFQRKPVDKALRKRSVPMPFAREELSVHLDGMQFVFEREVWKNLNAFIVGGPVEVGAEMPATLVSPVDTSSTDSSSDESPRSSPRQRKKKKVRLSKWFLGTKATIAASNLLFILPRLDGVDKPGVAENALYFSVPQFTFSNHPDWRVPPYLNEEAAALLSPPADGADSGTPPAASEPETTVLAAQHAHNKKVKRFQFDFVRMQAWIVPFDGSLKPAVLLEPATVHMYGRYCPRQRAQKIPRRVEVAIQSEDLTGRIGRDERRYLRWLVRSLKAWSEQLKRERQERRQMKAMLAAAASGAVGELKLTQMQDAASKKRAERKKKRKKAAKKGLKFTLDKVTFLFLLKLEQGVLHASLPMSAPASIEEVDANANSTPNTNVVVKQEKKKKPTVEVMAEIKFQLLELVIDNNIVSQDIVFRLRSFYTRGLDHPKFPSSTILLPLPGSASALDSFHRTSDALSLRYRRFVTTAATATGDGVREATFASRVSARMQGLRLVSIAKPGMKQQMKLLIPDIKKTATKLASTFKKKKSDMKAEGKSLSSEAKSYYEQAKAAASKVGKKVFWAAEMGDCEIWFVDAKTAAAPGFDPITLTEKDVHGILKVSNLNRTSLNKLLDNLEGQLIKTKMRMAQSESDKDALLIDLREKEEEIKKLKRELENIEQLMISNKLELAQAQTENDQLRQELRKLRGSAGSPGPNTIAAASSAAAQKKK